MNEDIKTNVMAIWLVGFILFVGLSAQNIYKPSFLCNFPYFLVISMSVAIISAKSAELDL